LKKEKYLNFLTTDMKTYTKNNLIKMNGKKRAPVETVQTYLIVLKEFSQL